MDHFYLLKPQEGHWEQTIKKSDFLIYLARVESEEEAQKKIEQVNKKHYKATHNVFAYVIGDNDEIKRYTDDGEPSGTAGVPMLEVLQKQGVHNVLAVVTRYFGGIKLGAGGLIRAYAGTTAQGLDALGLVERLNRAVLELTVDYSNNDELTYWLKQEDYPLIDTTFDTAVHHQVAVDPKTVKAFEESLTNRFAGRIRFEKVAETYLEIPKN
ncbi:YigZ family protein [Fructobacillus sp. M1-13]|uniref:YigZ family protein n=1 Tax=Fructobacillus papyriferae TaxID=2713171 RepID=A0ABS5QTF8_9LACO|nr:YigZ family protein [Fructobacillus papyriferae]MBS9335609.1 YigZ family protein [Fructobacillus papyriferae]MCD2159302.1 YigZ family protein [Fructobacillus papyriferae]